MITTAGDQIDATFGAALGLSALAAAGLGNLVSDVVGIQASTVIDVWATRLGLPSSGLSAAQLSSRAARSVTVIASMLGISVRLESVPATATTTAAANTAATTAATTAAATAVRWSGLHQQQTPR